MDKVKLFLFTTVALLLLNLVTLGFLFFNGYKGKQPPDLHVLQGRPEPKEIIIHKLNFDAAQITKYEKLIQWHRNKIRRIEDKIRKTKNKLYLQLNENTVNSNIKDSLINTLASYQKQIESTHFKHFQDIKEMCTKEQLNNFNSLTEDLVKLFSNPRKPMRNENHPGLAREGNYPPPLPRDNNEE